MPTQPATEAMQVWPARVAAAERRRDAPPRPAPPVPDHIMLSCISREGAFGDVWLARSVMGTYRAVKVVHSDRFDNEFPYNTEFEGLSRFHDLSREHPGFVDILHVSRNDHDGYFFYVMELADNLKRGPDSHDCQPLAGLEYAPCTLASLMETCPGRRLPVRECIRIALELTEAVIELHQHKLAHRDIKPSNVLLVKGRAKLGDIGLVTEMSDQFLPAIGTPKYMDMELHGTARGDLYSLGKVIYVAATGNGPEAYPAWPADPGMSDAEIKELQVLNDDVLCKVCDDDRSKRPQTVEELRADLLEVQAQLHVSEFAQFKRVKESLRQYGLAAGIILVLLVAALWLWNVQRQQAGELLLRQVGAAVANGNRAVEAGDLAGALPWFSEALRLDEGHSERARSHRLRLGSTLQQAPALAQMWFRSPRLYYAEYGQDSGQILASDGDHRWSLFDVPTGKRLSAPFFYTGTLGEHAHLSPAGGRAVVVPFKEPPQVWDLHTGQVTMTLPLSNVVYTTIFSPDGGRLLTTSGRGSVILWDSQTGVQLHQLEAHSADTYVLCGAFSRDGRRLVTADWHGQAFLWDVSAQPEILHQLPGHTNGIWHATFSPDGRIVATASLDWTVRLWDVASGQIKGLPLRHNDAVRGVGFSPDGAWLVSAGWDFAAHVWEVASGQRRLRLPHNSKVMHAAFSPDGRHILTVDHDGVIRVWNPKLEPLAPVYQSLAVSDDGSALLRFRTNGIVWADAGTDRPLALLTLTNRSPDNTFASPDGTGLVTLDGADGTQQVARLWSRAMMAPVAPPVRVDAAFKRPVLDGSGRSVAFFTDTEAVVLDLTRSREILRVAAPPRAVFRRAALSMNGQRLALASGRTVQLWDVADEPTLLARMELTMDIERLVFDPDGRHLLAACSDNSIDPGSAHVMDAAIGQVVGSPLRHRDGVCDAAFRYDGQRVLTCGEDGDAILWETRTSRAAAQPLRHPWHVKCGSFSPDGRWVATGCRDRTVRLWDAATGEPLTPPLRQPEVPAQIQFAGPRRLLVRGASGATWLVDLALDWRPSADLHQIAQLLSAQSVFSAGGSATYLPGGLECLWNRVRQHFPQEFTVSR